MESKSYPQRKSPRLHDYDYSSAGVYFVTICTARREQLFGSIRDSVLFPSALGGIVLQELAKVGSYWTNLEVDCFTVMPNHIHLLIALELTQQHGTVSEGSSSQAHPLLGTVIGNFKAGVTRVAHQQAVIQVGAVIWQSRYHDQIVRSEQALQKIREYVQYNPARWETDGLYSSA